MMPCCAKNIIQGNRGLKISDFATFIVNHSELDEENLNLDLCVSEKNFGYTDGTIRSWTNNIIFILYST